jgi:mRNA interferase MazF
MTTPNKWEIWLAHVMFEDGTALKKRPVLVISPELAYIISLKITTHSPREEFEGEYQIIKWREAGLKKQSTVRVSKILKMTANDFIHKIGILSPNDAYEVQILWDELHDDRVTGKRSMNVGT